MLVLPASAAYEWDNNITIDTDRMTWEYTEKYSGERSIVFKKLIDMEFGDNNDFVSAWELLKTDVETSKSFLKSIENNMDVEIDNSSRNVTLLRVETEMSRELIGSVDEESDIVNRYKVFYDFKTPLTESGSNMWFQGEPETDVTINLPADMNLVSVEGIDNWSLKDDPEGDRIKGEFDFSGEAVIHFEMVQEPAKIQQENTTEVSSTPVVTTRIEDLLDKLFPGNSDELIEKLNSDRFNIY